MAAYQFVIELIPNGTNPWRRERLDVERTWTKYADNAARVAEIIDTIIPRAKSFADGMFLWGNTETDDVQLWSDGGRVQSLTARLNCAEPSALFIQHVAKLAELLKLSAVMEGCHTLIERPNVFQIATYARQSKAAALGSIPSIKNAAVGAREFAERWARVLEIQ